MRCANEVHDGDCVIPAATCSRVVDGEVLNWCWNCAAYLDFEPAMVVDEDTIEAEA